LAERHDNVQTVANLLRGEIAYQPLDAADLATPNEVRNCFDATVPHDVNTPAAPIPE
jgi:hypothetical protein